MEYTRKEILLKNGKTCLLRRAEEADAEMMIEYLKAVWGETRYLMREPEDITLTVEKERDILRDKADSDAELMLVAEVDGKHAGVANFHPVGVRNRASHRCSVGVTLYKAFWGMGIGTELLDEVLTAARAAGFEQAELEVVSTNAPAIGLYRKLGFTSIGTMPHALKYKDGSYEDFLLMVKQL